MRVGDDLALDMHRVSPRHNTGLTGCLCIAPVAVGLEREGHDALHHCPYTADAALLAHYSERPPGGTHVQRDVLRGVDTRACIVVVDPPRHSIYMVVLVD